MESDGSSPLSRLDRDTTAQDRNLPVVAFVGENESLDEMGIGAIRDAKSTMPDQVHRWHLNQAQGIVRRSVKLRFQSTRSIGATARFSCLSGGSRTRDRTNKQGLLSYGASNPTVRRRSRCDCFRSHSRAVLAAHLDRAALEQGDTNSPLRAAAPMPSLLWRTGG